MKRFYRVENFFLLVILLTMLNNLEHQVNVYQRISKHTWGDGSFDFAYSLFAVITLDLVVFAFVIVGRHRTALLYASGIFIILLIYSDGVNIFQLHDLADGDRINAGIAKVIYALMFTYALYEFSRIYWERIKSKHVESEAVQRVSSLCAERDQLDAALKTTRAALEQAVSSHKAELIRSDAAIKKLEAALKESDAARIRLDAQLQVYMSRLTCPGCKEIFEDAYKLNGHKKSCASFLAIHPKPSLNGIN